MDFDTWWQNHGRHNASAKGIADQYVRELMSLAFEVGSEGKREAVAAERKRWEKALGAEMPADFKCWHQNAASERPEVAAWVIRNLREREALAWSEAAQRGVNRRREVK